MTRPVLLSLSIATLSPLLLAQPQWPQQPPRLLPAVQPPVPHPAYAGQPMLQPGPPEAAVPQATRTWPSAPAAPCMDEGEDEDHAEALAAAFLRQRIAGKDLEQAVARSTGSLRWHKTMASARDEARARSRPILLVQALGELDGFA